MLFLPVRTVTNPGTGPFYTPFSSFIFPPSPTLPDFPRRAIERTTAMPSRSCLGNGVCPFFKAIQWTHLLRYFASAVPWERRRPRRLLRCSKAELWVEGFAILY